MSGWAEGCRNPRTHSWRACVDLLAVSPTTVVVASEVPMQGMKEIGWLILGSLLRAGICWGALWEQKCWWVPFFLWSFLASLMLWGAIFGNFLFLVLLTPLDLLLWPCHTRCSGLPQPGIHPLQPLTRQTQYTGSSWTGIHPLWLSLHLMQWLALPSQAPSTTASSPCHAVVFNHHGLHPTRPGTTCKSNGEC